MAINTIIQGTAAEIMKIGMTKVYQFLKNHQNYKNKLILQIHDEILIETDENEAEYIAIESKKIMENIVEWNVNLNVDFKISDYWN